MVYIYNTDEKYKEQFELILPKTLFLQEKNDVLNNDVNCLNDKDNKYGFNNYNCNNIYPFDIISDIDPIEINNYRKVFIPKGKKGDDGDQGIQGPASHNANNFTTVEKINTNNDILPINVIGNINIDTNYPINLKNKSICKNDYCFDLNSFNLVNRNINALNNV